MSEDDRGREIRREIHIDATPATVFALLTDARQMTKWLAEIVVAEAVAGGKFHITEAGGMEIVGSYVEVVPDRKVVFTWGGIEGLKPGESTVEFTPGLASPLMVTVPTSVMVPLLPTVPFLLAWPGMYVPFR